MSELRLYLHRTSLRDNADCNWVLRDDEAGRVLASGGGLDNLPAARRCHVVLAADLVSVFPARLPDLSPHKLEPLLPGAAEAHALGEAEQLHVALLGRDVQGMSWLAVTDRGWLQATLARLAEKGVHPDAAAPEFLLLPLEQDAWSVASQEDGALLRMSPICGLALDQGDPPAGLRLALDAAAVRPERLCLFHDGTQPAVDPAAWQDACRLPVTVRGSWSWRSAAWPEGLNLLQGVFLPRHDRLDLGFLWRPLLWGSLTLALIHVSAMAIDTFLLAREQAGLQAQMRQQAERVLPPNATIADPVWQVGALLKALPGSNVQEQQGMLALLGQIGKVQPDGNPELKALAFDAGRLSLEYARVDQGWLAAFLAALKAGGLSAVFTPSGESGGTLVVARGSGHEH